MEKNDSLYAVVRCLPCVKRLHGSETSPITVRDLFWVTMNRKTGMKCILKARGERFPTGLVLVDIPGRDDGYIRRYEDWPDKDPKYGFFATFEEAKESIVGQCRGWLEISEDELEGKVQEVETYRRRLEKAETISVPENLDWFGEAE